MEKEGSKLEDDLTTPPVSLTTVEDFILHATDDNIDRLLLDFRHYIQLRRHHTQIMGIDDGATMGKTFEWLDTHEHNLYINMTHNEWASHFPVGRVIKIMPEIFDPTTKVVFLINDTGAVINDDTDRSWLEAAVAWIQTNSVENQ